MKRCKQCLIEKDYKYFVTNGTYKGKIKYKASCKSCTESLVVHAVYECNKIDCSSLTENYFCSVQCSNNSRTKLPTLCYCGKNTSSHNNKYCSVRCGAELITAYKINEWLNGTTAGWTGKTRQLRIFVRRHIKETRGSSCQECGWDEIHPCEGNSLTEVDHIDGNAENCVPENLKILCPNCHSKTPTFRARNRKSKRLRK